jgi:hypothetical protein
MNEGMQTSLWHRFRASRSELVVLALVFLAIGTGMNAFGKWARIAHFRHDWQIATCYLGYVLPMALLIRGLSFPIQYCVCVTLFVPLEVGGYALGSSVAFDDNAFEFFGIRSFTAVMCAGVALIPPIGLRVGQWIRELRPESARRAEASR